MSFIKKLTMLILLSSSLFAGTLYFGGGIVAGGGQEVGTYSGDDDDDTWTDSIQETGASGKIGYITDSNNRIEIALNRYYVESVNGWWDDVYTGLDLNYLITFRPKETLHPYFGIGIGGYESKKMYQDDEDGDTKHLTSYSANISLGLLISIFEHVELDMNIQAKVLKWNINDDNYDLRDEMIIGYTGVNIPF